MVKDFLCGLCVCVFFYRGERVSQKKSLKSSYKTSCMKTSVIKLKISINFIYFYKEILYLIICNMLYS